MTHARNKVRWCLKKAEKEGRKHRGLRRIAPDSSVAENHLRKAEHNLEVMDHLVRAGFHDWAIPASFYAHYHCLLALLRAHGYESRNQECTFAAIEHLVEQGTLALEKEDLHRIAAGTRDELEEADIVDLRERFQYGTETVYEKRRMEELQEQTKGFIEKAKTLLHGSRP